MLAVSLEHRQHRTNILAAFANIAFRLPTAPTSPPLSLCTAFPPEPPSTRLQYLYLILDLSSYQHVYKLHRLLVKYISGLVVRPILLSCPCSSVFPAIRDILAHQFLFISSSSLTRSSFGSGTVVRTPMLSSTELSTLFVFVSLYSCSSLSSTPSTLIAVAMYSSSYQIPGVASGPALTWLPCRCQCQEHARTVTHILCSVSITHPPLLISSSSSSSDSIYLSSSPYSVSSLHRFSAVSGQLLLLATFMLA